MAARKSVIRKRIGDFLRRVARVEFGKAERALSLVHARQRHKRIHELRKLLRLRRRLADPLLRSVFHLENLQARCDNRYRGFKLMPRVGDELLLLFGCSDHGIDRAARAKQDYHIHEKDAECRCAHGKKRRHENSAHLLMAVEKDCHIASYSSEEAYSYAENPSFTVSTENRFFSKNAHSTSARSGSSSAIRSLISHLRPVRRDFGGGHLHSLL